MSYWVLSDDKMREREGVCVYVFSYIFCFRHPHFFSSFCCVLKVVFVAFKTSYTSMAFFSFFRQTVTHRFQSLSSFFRHTVTHRLSSLSSFLRQSHTGSSHCLSSFFRQLFTHRFQSLSVFFLQTVTHRFQSLSVFFFAPFFFSVLPVFFEVCNSVQIVPDQNIQSPGLVFLLASTFVKCISVVLEWNNYIHLYIVQNLEHWKPLMFWVTSAHQTWTAPRSWR